MDNGIVFLEFCKARGLSLLELDELLGHPGT